MEPCAFIVINWLTGQSGCQALNAHALLRQEAREGCERAASCFSTSVLHANWKQWIYMICNTAYPLNGSPFSFDVTSDPPEMRKTKSTSWRYPGGRKRSASLESDRGKIISNLAAAARVFQDRHKVIEIEGIPPRNWTRMLRWCQASMGTGEYVLEHERAHGPPKLRKAQRGWGGRRPGRRGGRGGRVQETESEEEE